MAKFSRFKHMERTSNDTVYMFYCPGCQCGHWVRCAGDGVKWSIDGIENNVPTVSPSICVKSGPKMSNVCHFFIKEGYIHYLNDCTHGMKNEVVEIPDFDGIWNAAC